jgi:hypothetical protein
MMVLDVCKAQECTVIYGDDEFIPFCNKVSDIMLNVIREKCNMVAYVLHVFMRRVFKLKKLKSLISFSEDCGFALWNVLCKPYVNLKAELLVQPMDSSRFSTRIPLCSTLLIMLVTPLLN